MRPMDQEKYQPWVSLLFWKCLCNALAPWYDCRVYAPFMFLLISQRTVVQAHTHNAREQKNVFLLIIRSEEGSQAETTHNVFCLIFLGILDFNALGITLVPKYRCRRPQCDFPGSYHNHRAKNICIVAAGAQHHNTMSLTRRFVSS